MFFFFLFFVVEQFFLLWPKKKFMPERKDIFQPQPQPHPIHVEVTSFKIRVSPVVIFNQLEEHLVRMGVGYQSNARRCVIKAHKFLVPHLVVFQVSLYCSDGKEITCEFQRRSGDALKFNQLYQHIRWMFRPEVTRPAAPRSPSIMFDKKTLVSSTLNYQSGIVALLLHRHAKEARSIILANLPVDFLERLFTAESLEAHFVGVFILEQLQDRKLLKDHSNSIRFLSTRLAHPYNSLRPRIWTMLREAGL